MWLYWTQTLLPLTPVLATESDHSSAYISLISVSEIKPRKKQLRNLIERSETSCACCRILLFSAQTLRVQHVRLKMSRWRKRRKKFSSIYSLRSMPRAVSVWAECEVSHFSFFSLVSSCCAKATAALVLFLSFVVLVQRVSGELTQRAFYCLLSIWNSFSAFFSRQKTFIWTWEISSRNS